MSLLHWLVDLFHGHSHDDEGPSEEGFYSDKEAFQSDIKQIKHVNDYLLNKALARGWVSDEVAEAIKTAQPTNPIPPREEHYRNGTDSK